ncbi:MAG: hypothetical protein Q8O67_20545 [Deltaproteobacteria bacterium]|nr:hypothetical protein [Deltaproteobacteria bacterium]
MKTLLLGACTVGLLTSGCLQERTYLDPEQNLGPNAGTSSNMSLRDGRLAGDFGPRRGFDGEATSLEGTNDPQYGTTTVNVVREQQSVGAGMVILSISNKTLDDFQAGEHRFSYDQNDLSSNSTILANVCSGSDMSGFDYDSPAESGTLTIEDTSDGLRHVDIHTETPVIDQATGIPTDAIELSDASFSYTPTQR